MTNSLIPFEIIAMSSWMRFLCAAILGVWIFAGCTRRPEAAKQADHSNAHESSEAVPPSAEPSDQRTGTQLAAQILISEPSKPQSEEDPVSVRLHVAEQATIGKTFEFAVVLNIDLGYEIHNLHALPPKIPTQLELQLPPGFLAVEDWNSPTPIRSFNPGGDLVYVGESQFNRKIHVTNEVEPGDYLLGCSVSYQACNARQCLRPIEASLSVKVSVSH